MRNFLKLISSTLITIAVIFAFMLTLKYYPDILWFSSFQMADVWWISLSARLGIFAGVFACSYIFLGFNIYIASRISRKPVIMPDLDSESTNPIQTLLREAARQFMPQASYVGTVSTVMLHAAALGISAVIGMLASHSWLTIYSYFQQTAYHMADPIFKHDISFYLFSLPFFKLIQTWLFFLIFIAFGLLIWVYSSRQILSTVFSAPPNRIPAKTHLFLLAALLCLVILFGLGLNTFNILFSKKSVIYGAGYTDLFALLPAYKLIAGGLLLEVILFIIYAFRRGFKPPLYLLAGLILAGFGLFQVYPQLLQKYIVQPNELSKEKEFIAHNIAYTRMAYQLNNVQEEQFPVNNNLTAADINRNKTTINNIRLWNEEPIGETFRQLQEIRLYYDFSGVDVDRYRINGDLQQVLVSARELNSSQLSKEAQRWTNRHLVYTHGYGAIMSPVNKVTPDGLPYFYMKDLPPVSSLDFSIKRPEIYFGERNNEYILVNTAQPEFDYPKGDQNVYTQYTGNGGIQLDTLLKRAIFALKQSDINILISSQVSKKSRIMYDRTVMTIVNKIAPFLIFETDPYLVMTRDGRMVWMLDAYTASSHYPYSTPFNAGINYIRNSVKVTVDAYDGTVRFYMMKNDDPIIKTYAKIFPTLFKPFEDMPADLKSHIRYPKQLFMLQAQMLNTYHMLDPQVFYNREDLWALPRVSDSAEKSGIMNAYYMVTKLPKEKDESFLIMVPLTPTNKNNMIAWLSADCDIDDYGKLKVYKFPKDKTIYGPMQIESRIDQDTDISQKLTLWGQMGSRVIRGNLMVIPVEDSLVYVEPLYLQATSSKMPELKRVIVGYGDSIIMDETLQGAFSQIFGAGAGIADKDEPKAAEAKPNTAAQTAQALIQTLATEFKQLKQAARDFNWTEFGNKLNMVDQTIQQLEQKKQ